MLLLSVITVRDGGHVSGCRRIRVEPFRYFRDTKCVRDVTFRPASRTYIPQVTPSRGEQIVTYGRFIDKIPNMVPENSYRAASQL